MKCAKREARVAPRARTMLSILHGRYIYSGRASVQKLLHSAIQQRIRRVDDEMTLAGSDAEKAAGLLEEREDGSGSVSNADCDVDCRKAISEVFTLLQALEAEQNLLYKDWEDTRTTAPHLVSASNQVAAVEDLADA